MGLGRVSPHPGFGVAIEMRGRDPRHISNVVIVGQRFLPARSPHGRLRRHSLRSVFDAFFYLLRTECPWRYFPSNFPPWQTVYYHWRQFCRTGLWTCLYRALRDAERRRVGRDPHPTAAITDAQSVKTVEESGRIRGYDAHNCA